MADRFKDLWREALETLRYPVLTLMVADCRRLEGHELARTEPVQALEVPLLKDAVSITPSKEVRFSHLITIYSEYKINEIDFIVYIKFLSFLSLL